MDSSAKNIAFITLGCAKNEVDTDHMARLVRAAGYRVVDDAENADAIVVNTCSFIQAATEESIDAIFDVCDLDSVKDGKAKTIIAGCMVSRYGKDLEEELPEAAAFMGCKNEGKIVEILDNMFGIDRVGMNAAFGNDENESTCMSAYVKISDGCDRFCAFCTIPYIRGRYRSFSFDEICSEVDLMRGRGAREIVLIAQDTSRWGDDFDTPLTLAWLMGKLAERYPETWFRVMYIQPEGITDELLETMACYKNICSYLDIPFQHANGRILKAMNRKGDAESYLALVEHIRQTIPGVTLRTTIMTGFPGEGETEFEELCDFVESIDFDYVGVFAFSCEDGTKASRLGNQVDQEEKEARAQRIRDIGDSVSSSVIARKIGTEMPVLVCGYDEEGYLYGRAMSQAPDVDGLTFIDSGEPGEIVMVRIEDTLMYDMEGTVCS